VKTGRVETIPFTAPVHRVISEAVRTRLRITDEPFEPRFLRWPVSSPDGRRLVFEAVGKLWVTELPRGEPKRLTPDSSQRFEGTPAWSPDGRWIAYATWDDRGEERGQVWKIAAAGGAPQRLSAAPGEYLYPTWSADGASLVAARGPGATTRGQWWEGNEWWELARLPADGGPMTWLTETDQLVRPSLGNGRVYYLERRGEQNLLAAARHGEVPENRWALLSIGSDGRGRREHLTLPGEGAVVSPRGDWVAFTDRFELYLAPLAGGPHAAPLAKSDPRVRRLTRQGGLYPHWRDAPTPEFVIGARYYAHHVATGRTDTVRLRLSIPREVPRGSIALTNARILTLDRRQVIDRGTVLVSGSRIACVGECDAGRADRTLDLGGQTVIPGLVDLHAHHLATFPGLVPQHRSESARYLAHGVTTALDPATTSDPAFPVAGLIEAGEVVGPRTYSGGDFLSGYGGTSDIHTYRDAVDQVSRLVEWGAATIKDYHQPSRRERQMLAPAARQAGVTTTAEGEDLFRNLALIIDGHPGWEHNLPYTPLYRDAVEFFARAGVEYSATLNVSSPALRGQEYWLARSDVWNDPKQRRWVPWRELVRGRYYTMRPVGDYAFPLLAEGLADMVRGGARGAVGGHGEWLGLDTHWDLWSGAMALSPMEALEVATWQGASYVGLDQDLGTIAVGKLADLVVLGANPLDDIKNTRDIRYVMKGGRLYEPNTLDQLWPEQKPYGQYPWVSPDALRSDRRAVDYWDRH